jgi:hypothetical protein
VLGSRVPWTGRVLGVAPPDAWAGPRTVGTRPDGRSGRHQGSGFSIRMPPPGHTHRHNRASGKDPPQCASHRYWHLRLVPLRTWRKVVPDPERLLFVTKGDRMSEYPPIPRHEDQVAQVPNDTIGRELLGTIHKPILPGLADPHPCLGIDVPCRPGTGNIACDRQARRRDGSPRIHWPA